MLCAVCGCNNSKNKNNKVTRGDISFFHFPQDPDLLKQWIHFCNRKDVFRTKRARICSDHFTSEDWQRNYKLELGLTDIKRLHLKPGSVPSVYRKEDGSSAGSSSIVTRGNPKIIESQMDTTESTDISTCQNCTVFRSKMQRIEGRCNHLLRTEIELKNKIKTLELKLEQSELQKSIIEEKLSTIFTNGQIKKLWSMDTEQQRWSEVDIARSITFYSANAKAYKFLKKKNFPLPSVRTLRSWAQKIDLTPGVLQPVVRILKATTDMNEAQKVCVLSFDEMTVKNSFCYNETTETDTTLAPAGYVQVAMLRGLMSDWKQPIFYSFECKITSIVLKNILEKVIECGYTIVAIVSDLKKANLGLFKELEISLNKPWFPYRENKIFVFADVPHLLTILRNHFLDHGFLINGKEIKKNLIVEILSSTSTELTNTHKINHSHLSVSGTERQKVEPAAELFSRSTAQAVCKAANLGLLKEPNWEECYKLLKLTSDWFDVMNVRTQTSDSAERVRAYGLALTTQNEILDQMSELMSNMKVIGETTLLPFQEGIIQSNSAIQLLFEDLVQRFGFKYVLTYNLNQSDLENTLNLLRRRGELHDDPDREEFRYRLRSHILGHKKGAISNTGYVSSDDTLVLEPPLTGIILKNIVMEPVEDKFDAIEDYLKTRDR